MPAPIAGHPGTAPTFGAVRSIACIGAGYVGGPTCAVIAQRCPHIRVTVLDINAARIAAWNSDTLPIFEPGLDAVVREARGRNLFFSTDMDRHIPEADLIFVSVNTPTKTSGLGAGTAPDLHYVEEATRMIARLAIKDTILVEKSTVPCKTADSMRQILQSTSPKPGIHFRILSNPEFLAEGTAVQDLYCPDRVLIGSLADPLSVQARNALVDVYANWVRRESILETDLWSSELTKLASNALLAQRVSSINALAVICEETGANVGEVAAAAGRDARIGRHFLQAGLGFGGSCFQKDILNLIYLCDSLNLAEVGRYWQQVLAMNEYVKARFARRVIRTLFSTLTNKRVALLGFAFKKDTGDIREAPAITIAKTFLDEAADVVVYDPKVPAEMVRGALGGRGTVATTAEEACCGAHAIVIATEWDEFREDRMDWEKVYASMKKPAFLFDGRAMLDVSRMAKIGFRVHSVGRGKVAEAEY